MFSANRIKSFGMRRVDCKATKRTVYGASGNALDKLTKYRADPSVDVSSLTEYLIIDNSCCKLK